MELEQLSWKVDTAQLKTAIDMVDSLAKALGNLHTVQSKETKVAIEATKIKEAEAAASKAVAEATTKEAQAKESVSKANKKAASDSKDTTDTIIAGVEKVVQRTEYMAKFIGEGYRRSFASALTNIELLGGGTETQFKRIKEAFDRLTPNLKDPFDSVIGPLISINNELDRLKNRANLVSQGIGLTTKQLDEYSRIYSSIESQFKSAGKDLASKDNLVEFNKLLGEQQKQYLSTATAVNDLTEQERIRNKESVDNAKAQIKAEADRERAVRDSFDTTMKMNSLLKEGEGAQYGRDMSEMRKFYEDQESLALKNEADRKVHFDNLIQIHNWKQQQDKQNYDQDMAALRSYYNDMEKEANDAERYMSALNSRIAKETASAKYLNAGATRSTANVASGMEIRGVPQDVIDSFVKEATAKEQAAKSGREAASANEFLAKEEARLSAALQDTNKNLSRQATDELVAIQRALQKSGLSADEATAKFSIFEKQLNEVAFKEKAKDMQYLARAMSVQLGDIGVSLASGMNPLLVMIQQGDQMRGIVQQVGADTQQMKGVMSTALGQIASSFALVGSAVGSFFTGSIQTAGRAITDFGLRITGTNAIMDKYYASLLNQGPPDKFTAGMLRIADSARSVLNVLVGIGTAGLIVALTLLVSSIVSVIKEQDRLAVSMGQFGQSMGVSFQSAILLTESLRSINIGSAKATESLIAMASTGKFVAAEFQMVTVAAVNMQKYAGISIEETVKSFAKMKEKPVEALYELAQATGMVTSAQISWISELVRTDRQTEASAAAIQILADVNAKQTERMKENLSGFAIFMKNLGSSISGFFDSAFKALWSKTDERALLVQKIEALKPSLDNKLLAAGTKADIAVLEQQLKMIDQTRKAQDDLAASQKSGQKAQQEFLEKINKYEDKDKVKMARAGSRAEYIKTEIEEYKKLYKEMTKTEEELGKRMYGEKWDTAHKAKKGKTDTEKEADRIKKYYDRIVEGANNANEETKGLAEGLNKYEIALNKVQNDDYFSKLSKVQQNNIGNLYKQAIAQEDVNIVQKLYNNLLGQADGLGADYYERLKVIARAADAGFDPAIIDKLQKKLYETTEQGKQYVSFMNELIKKTEELAIARAKLEGERNAILVGGVQGEYLKEQLSYQEKLAKAQKDYNAEQAKVNEFYISKSKAPADEEMRIAAMEKLKSVYDSTVANISFEQQTASLGKFTEQFSILIQSVELLGTSLTNVFGEFGSTLGNALSSFANLAAGMDQNARQIQAAMQSVADAKQKVIESSSYEELIKNTKKQTDAENVLAKTQKKSALSEITMYANLAGAAKSMFGEKTAAAKAFGAIEKVLHIARIGMMLVEVAQTIASVGPTVAANAAKTTSTMGSVVVDGAAAVVKTLASLPFPANVAAGAAVAALVAGIIGSVGGSFNGGSGSSSAAPVNEGTGTVFGDSSAKSESFAQAEEYLAEANLLTQKYTPQMLVHLRNIDAQIAGLVNLIIRTGDVQNATSSLGIKTGTTYSAVGQIADKITAPLRDSVTKGLPVVGAGDDKLVRALIGGIFGKVSTNVTGQGLTGEKQSLGNIMDNQFQGQYYTDVQVKKKSWFSSSTKNQTYLTEAGAELEQQITAVFKGIYDSVLVATESLGQSQSATRDVLDSFEVDIGRVSLQGTGAEIQERLSAVFGAAADSIAKAAMPGLEQFQDVGEGYFATLIRVATELDTVNGMFDMLGNTLFTLGISGVEASQSLIDLFGGLSEFQSSVSEYYDKFYTEEEKVVKQGEQLTNAFSSLGLTLPELSGDLQTSLNAYRDLVNSFDLTDPAQQEAYYSLIQLSDAFYDVALAASTTRKGVEELLADLNNQTRTNDDIANSTYGLQQDTRELQATYDDLISGATGANSALYKLTTEGMHPLEKAAYDDKLAIQAKIDAENESRKAAQEATKAREKAATDAISAFEAAVNSQKSLIQESIKSLQSLFDTLKKSIDDLYGNVASTAAMRGFEGRQFITNAITQARSGGSLPTSEAVSEAISAVTSEINSTQYATKAESEKAKLRFAAQLVTLKDLVEPKLSDAERQLKVLDETLTTAKAQLGLLGNINSSVLTVAQAILNLRSTTGVSVAIPAFASGGTYNGGLALVGEDGAEVINFNKPGTVHTAAETKAMMNGGGSEVVGELKQLRGEVIMLRAEVRADVVHNAKTAKILDRVASDGRSFLVTTAA